MGATQQLALKQQYRFSEQSKAGERPPFFTIGRSEEGSARHNVTLETGEGRFILKSRFAIANIPHSVPFLSVR